MTVGEQKAVLRKNLVGRRQKLAPLYVKNASQRIIVHLIDFINWEDVRSLHTYVPIARTNEIDTWPLLEYIWKHHPHILTAVPFMHHKAMLSRFINTKTYWEENKVGIPQPLDGTTLEEKHKFDVIIVPIQGFDRHGNRLGYGTGYYDKFLMAQQGITIGLAYAFSEIKPELPVEAHDITLQYIVTEDGVLKSHTKT